MTRPKGLPSCSFTVLLVLCAVCLWMTHGTGNSAAGAGSEGAAETADRSRSSTAFPPIPSQSSTGIPESRRTARARLQKSGLASELLLERPTDRLTPATPGGVRTQPARVVQAGGGGPVSVQVNVTANGSDIFGDAANEPSMAIDPTDPRRIVVGWRQFDTTASGFRQAGVAYSDDGGATWTSPGVIDPGVFRSDPVLDVNAGGDFYYSSLTSDGESFAVDMFKSFDGGMTWSKGVPAFGGDKQWLAVDRTGGVGAGHLYQHWSFNFSCCFPADFTRSTNGAASFELPLSMLSPKLRWGTSTVGPDGTLFIAGSAFASEGQVVARSRNAKNAAQTPVFDSVVGVDIGGYSAQGGINSVGLLGQTWIASDHSNGPSRGTLYMLGSVANVFSPNPLDVHIVRSVDDGETWSHPVRVNDDLDSGAWHWFGALSVAPNGRLDVTWYDTRNDASDPSDPVFSEIFYSYSLDQGRTWTPGISVSPPFNHYLGYPQDSPKLGDYNHMRSDNGGANLVYAATFNGGQDVYFLRIPMDCNHNGIEDVADIAQHGAEDCNHNAIPDDCEPNLNCNSNQTKDICDIGAGTSDDCDGNRVPDECESPVDCNQNRAQDFCDLADGTSKDCNENHVPDECDIASGFSTDRNHNDVPDECQAACCHCNTDCFERTWVDCTQMGGFPRELGTTCADVFCPPPPENDQCFASVQLDEALEHHEPIDNRCATGESGEFFTECDAGFQPFDTDLWFAYVSPCDGLLKVSLCGTGTFDSILAVYRDGTACVCPPSDPTPAACGDDSCGFGGGPSEVILPAVAGQCYNIRVGGWNAAVGLADMLVSLLPLPGGPVSETFFPFPPPRPGDCDSDRRLTPHDQAGFVECLLGPGSQRTVCCGCADLNTDGYVSLRDFALIQRSYGGTAD